MNYKLIERCEGHHGQTLARTVRFYDEGYTSPLFCVSKGSRATAFFPQVESNPTLSAIYEVNDLLNEAQKITNDGGTLNRIIEAFFTKGVCPCSKENPSATYSYGERVFEKLAMSQEESK